MDQKTNKHAGLWLLLFIKRPRHCQTHTGQNANEVVNPQDGIVSINSADDVVRRSRTSFLQLKVTQR